MPNLNLDRSTYQVQFSGNQVPLNNIEFEILWQLVSKPGKLLTEDDIFHSLPKSISEKRAAISKITHMVTMKIGHPGIRYIRGKGFQFGLQ